MPDTKGKSYPVNSQPKFLRMAVPNYVGAVIVAVAPGTGYGSDEFICVAQTDERLACISTKGGYHSHSLTTVPIVEIKEGEKTIDRPWVIAKFRFDDAYVEQVAARLHEFGTNPPLRDGKLEWVTYVYTDSVRNAELLRSTLATKQAAEQEAARRFMESNGFKKTPAPAVASPLVIEVPRNRPFVLKVI